MKKNILSILTVIIGCAALLTQCASSSSSGRYIGPTYTEAQALHQRIFYNMSGIVEKLENVKDRTSADVAAAHLFVQGPQMARDKRLADSPEMRPLIRQIILTSDMSERFSRLQVRFEKAERRIKAHNYYGSSNLRRQL